MMEQEKEMISEMLLRTSNKEDIIENLEKMKGSCAFKPSKECLTTYKELAELRIKRFNK